MDMMRAAGRDRCLDNAMEAGASQCANPAGGRGAQILRSATSLGVSALSGVKHKTSEMRGEAERTNRAAMTP